MVMQFSLLLNKDCTYITHNTFSSNGNAKPCLNATQERGGSVRLQSTEKQSFESLSLDEAITVLAHTTDVLSIDNYTCLLQKCRRQRDLHHAQHMYLHICDNGLELDRIVGNHLVPTFVECGSLHHAKQVFNKLEHRNEHSWTAILQGHVHCEQFEHTFSLYKRMKLACIDPSPHTFIPLLNSCSTLQDIDRGRLLHSEIVSQGFENDVFLGDTLINMYANCGSLGEAQHIFDHVNVRTAVTWTTLIAGYTEHGFGDLTLDFFEQMQLEGIYANEITYIFVLKACNTSKLSSVGQQMHTLIIEDGFENDPRVCSSLIDMYANCGLLEEARDMFDVSPVCNEVSWGALMYGHMEHGLFLEAVKIFKDIQSEGILANTYIFVCILKASSELGDLEFVQVLHHQIAKQGVDQDPFISNALMVAYANCGVLKETHNVFEYLKVRDIVSWTTIISIYVDYGYYNQAIHCVERMHQVGMLPNPVTTFCFLKACAVLGDQTMGHQLHDDVLKRGMESDVAITIALVEMYSLCSSFIEARQIVNDTLNQSISLWAALISGYAEYGLAEDVLSCLEDILRNNMSPDGFVIVWSLNACRSLKDIICGREIHIIIIQHGLEADPYVGSALVEMYVEFRLMEDAKSVFEILPMRDVVSWNPLIAGYAEQGYLMEAFNFMEKMLHAGTSPDVITFISILKYCATSGDVVMAQYLHALIIKHGFEGDSTLASTLIDMYARIGYVQEAQETFDKMVIKDVNTWTTLITTYTHFGWCTETINLCIEMQQDGVCPDINLFISILEACRRFCALPLGRETHSSIVSLGLETSDIVGSTLVLMYIAFDMLIDAWFVFNRLTHKSIIVWNELIHYYSKYGSYFEAYAFLEKMQQLGTCPNATTFVHLLGTKMEDGQGREVHMKIVKTGLEADARVTCSLIDMYGKYGSCVEAEKMFNTLNAHNTVSWTTLIACYANKGFGDKSIECFKQMETEHVLPDAITLTTVLKACRCARGTLDICYQIHSQVIMYGFESDPLTYSALIDAYLLLGSFEDAHGVFENLRYESLIAWSSLVSGYVDNYQYEDVLECLSCMQLNDILPDSTIFVYALKACGHTEDIHRGFKLHTDVIRLGLDIDPYIISTLIFMYSRCACFSEALAVFEKEPVQDIVSLTALISGYAYHGFDKEALKCLFQMQSLGMHLDEICLLCGIQACTQLGTFSEGQAFHMEIVKAGFEMTPRMGSALLNMYGKYQPVDEAEYLFGQFSVKDLVIWTEMLCIYVENGLAERALQCRQTMELNGLTLDAIALGLSLRACDLLSDLVRGGEIHTEAVKKGIEKNEFFLSNLVSFYGNHSSKDILYRR